MLKLVLGTSGSGKTTLLYARIRARAEAGKRSILLVPEQFTSSTEARIYRELGDALSGMVESYSFTSLAEHILAIEGGVAVQTLTDAGRAVLVRRALEELQDNVHYYYRHRRSAAFCQMAAETIDELKSAGLSGQQLQELARDCGTESAKLGELALIFQGYESLLAGTGMDPADRLELAADRLEAALARDELPDFLREREVFIDEFDTFNAPKKRLMGAMLAALPAVTVALCEDGAPMQPGDLELFSGAKQVAAQLRQLARKNGAQVAAPELLRLLLNGLYALAKLDKDPALVKPAFTFRLLALAGFEPMIDGCAVCGAETAQSPVLDVVQGVVHCRKCGGPGGESFPLSAACMTALEHILHGPDRKLYSFTLMPEDLRLLDRAAEGFAAAQLERSFRTLGYYKAILI